MTVCFHPKVRMFSKQSIPELEMISCLLCLSSSLLPGRCRLTSWSTAWTRWKRNASWRGTSHWNWKMILKTDLKRNRCWSWSEKTRWWKLKSRSYSPSFRYHCEKLCHFSSPLLLTQVMGSESFDHSLPPAIPSLTFHTISCTPGGLLPKMLSSNKSSCWEMSSSSVQSTAV